MGGRRRGASLTDWAGPAAGFSEPRHHNDVSPGPDTLHNVPHPANSSWYLCALAARRALTFLQQQPEVDGRSYWPLIRCPVLDAKGRPLDDWHEITELAFTPADKATEDDKAHPPWKGDPPRLRGLRWVGGTHVPRPKPYLKASQQRPGNAAEGVTKEFRRAVEGSVRRERD